MAEQRQRNSIILSPGMAISLFFAQILGSSALTRTSSLRLMLGSHQLQRHLQAQEGALPVCNADGTVNFDSDEANSVIFAGEFQPVCSCEEGTFSCGLPCRSFYHLNSSLSSYFTTFLSVKTDSQVLAAINALNISDTDAFVDGFNQALGQLARSSEYSCLNDCESCFADNDGNTLCGIWETREAMSIANRPGNFTLQQILSQNITTEDTIALISNATFAFDNCITYTVNQSGTLCASVNLTTIPVEGKDQPCTITYNDVTCNSCLITGVDACFVADCTNVHGDTKIDSCSTGGGTDGLVGPFVFLRYLSDDFGNSTGTNTTTVISPGRCDVAPLEPALVATPTATGASAPVMAPVRAAPNGALVPSLGTTSAASSLRLCLYPLYSWVLVGMALLLV
jgi:hypothetical protein